MQRAKSSYGAALNKAVTHPVAVAGIAVGGLAIAGILFSFLGREFIPTLDEKDIALHSVRIPSTSLAQSEAMQLEVEKKIASFTEVAFVYSKIGTAEMASDPMPPNTADTFIILKDKEEWPEPSLPKPELIERMEKALADVPGNNYEFTQPIQMRFNELIAGVRVM